MLQHTKCQVKLIEMHCLLHLLKQSDNLSLVMLLFKAPLSSCMSKVSCSGNCFRTREFQNGPILYYVQWLWCDPCSIMLSTLLQCCIFMVMQIKLTVVGKRLWTFGNDVCMERKIWRVFRIIHFKLTIGQHLLTHDLRGLEICLLSRPK